MTSELRIAGRTKSVRTVLKNAGWRWEPSTESWTRRITEQEVADIRAGGEKRTAVIKRHMGNRIGCIVYLCDVGTIGVCVWKSRQHQGGAAVVPGLDYCDWHGNYVGGRAIRGSAPDDRI